MIRVYIYCEGQTEESFIKRILRPYLQNFQIEAVPIISKTGLNNHKIQKGGVSTNSRMKTELNRL